MSIPQLVVSLLPQGLLHHYAVQGRVRETGAWPCKVDEAQAESSMCMFSQMHLHLTLQLLCINDYTDIQIPVTRLKVRLGRCSQEAQRNLSLDLKGAASSRRGQK